MVWCLGISRWAGQVFEYMGTSVESGFPGVGQAPESAVLGLGHGAWVLGPQRPTRHQRSLRQPDIWVCGSWPVAKGCWCGPGNGEGQNPGPWDPTPVGWSTRTQLRQRPHVSARFWGRLGAWDPGDQTCARVDWDPGPLGVGLDSRSTGAGLVLDRLGVWATGFSPVPVQSRVLGSQGPAWPWAE